MLTFGSLFTGIAGLDLAAAWAGFDVRWQTDYDEYCMQTCKRHFPGARQITSDVKALRGCDLAPVDVVAGGPPCQPFSLAGKRTGTADDRHLWPEMLRLIREIDPRPRAVIFENVPGSLDLLLPLVLSDLENAGYHEHYAFLFPVVAFGAPHERDRVFVVAYPDEFRRLPAPAGDSADHQHGIDPAHQSRRKTKLYAPVSGGQNLGNTARPRLPVGQSLRNYAAQKQPTAERTGHSPGIGGTEPRLGRDFNGLPVWLDYPHWPAFMGQPQHEWEPPRTADPASVPERVNRIRALGNAVSPVQAYPLMCAVRWYLEESDHA